MPSPKWKLVVDIGDVEETTSIPIGTAVASNGQVDHLDVANPGTDDAKEAAVHPPAVGSNESILDDNMVAHHQGVHVAAAAPAAASQGRDPRIDAVVALLGEYMPSDPQSPVSPYLSGFMSLRLLLLRPSRSTQDDELTRTMLDSYQSYTVGGRARSDIAVMLARDFMFLSQQNQAVALQQSQQASMLSLDGPMMQGTSHVASSSNSTGLSLFGLPSTSSSLQNSPALAPIPAPGSHDSLSIVSN